MGRIVDAQKARIDAAVNAQLDAAHAKRVRAIHVLEDHVFFPQWMRVQKFLNRIDTARAERLAREIPVNEKMHELDLKEYRR